ncbi:hypothetical protein [Metabacillus iocasae]|uniref:Tissue inhibitor of metalloproteinase n=1 Tax=Priestia iocasae TaxID=2291674 RepID=A0ABS2QSH5_9BACI|nr:hypothetical protein [Metabacillus iocasae]MBM7702415.1 hypothetical protein [Metabacillus iocasae]
MKSVSYLLLATLFLLSFFTFSPSKSYACSCVPTVPVKEELEQSDAVFSGKVIRKEHTKQNLYNDGFAMEVYAVTFEVNRVWKGASNSHILVYTGMGGGDCGYSFKEGTDYLVYAHGNDQLIAEICSRTAELSSANEDLTILGEGMKPENEGDLPPAENPRILEIGLGIMILLIGSFLFIKKRKASS